MHHLDGVQAVAYARLRYMDNDFARTERQRKVVTQAFEKAKKTDLNTLNGLLGNMLAMVATNLTWQDGLDAIANVNKYHLGENGGFPFARGDANMGKKGACVIPQTLESNVKELHKFLFDDETYEVSATVKQISNKISSDSGMYNEGKYVGHVSTDGGYIGYTGEISLTGGVFPVGGLTSKIQAAIDSGCTKVFIPQENYNLLDKNKLNKYECTIIPVSHLSQVINEIYPELKLGDLYV